jgi:uncharacterized membrane protein
MENNKILASISAAALTLSAGTSMASEQQAMDKCKINVGGKGFIKAKMADCAGKNHSCAGQNEAGDPYSWIMVPQGKCEQINRGNFEGISADIKSKIQVEKLKNALEKQNNSKGHEKSNNSSSNKEFKTHEMKGSKGHLKPESNEATESRY